MLIFITKSLLPSFNFFAEETVSMWASNGTNQTFKSGAACSEEHILPRCSVLLGRAGCVGSKSVVHVKAPGNWQNACSGADALETAIVLLIILISRSQGDFDACALKSELQLSLSAPKSLLTCTFSNRPLQANFADPSLLLE